MVDQGLKYLYLQKKTEIFDEKQKFLRSICEFEYWQFFAIFERIGCFKKNRQNTNHLNRLTYSEIIKIVETKVV